MNWAWLRRAPAWLLEDKRSTYGLAVARMLMGGVIAAQLVVNWPDRHYAWGDATSWTEPVRGAKSWSAPWSLFQQLDGRAFDLGYVLTILFALCLAIGFTTRLAAIMTLFLWMSLYVANPFVGSGGDAVLRMTLLYVCLTDSGRRWSVDAWLRARRGDVREWIRPWITTLFHNIGLILMIHQIIIVYVASAFWKVQSPRWLDGTAVYYPLHTDAYSPWHDILQPLFTLAPVIAGASWMAIIAQLLFPVLLVYRPTRMLALVVITGMHAGIGIFMGIGFFSLAMIAVDVVLVSDASWASAWQRANRIALPLVRKSHTQAISSR